MAESIDIDYQALQTEKILNEKFLTLIIEVNGDYSIDYFSINDRRSFFNFDDDISSSAITYSNGQYREVVSLFHKDNYRITQNCPSQNDKLEQENFKMDNSALFNPIASLMANKLDNNDISCIIGDCAFVFEDTTMFAEVVLRELMEKMTM